jgi:transposase
MENKKTPIFDEIRHNVAGIDIAGRADHYVCGPRKEDGSYEIVAFGTTTKELYRLLKWLQERGVVSVAMESTSVYWIPLTDLLESNSIEVVLVDSREVRMVPGRKSDVQDCQWLQKLHSCGLLRGAFRPSEDVAAIRTILREKESLMTMRVQSIQQMQKSLDQMNVRVHHAVSDINGKTGLSIIKAIVNGERCPTRLSALRDRRIQKSAKEVAEHLTGTWRSEHLFNLEQAYKTMTFLDERIAEYDSRIAAMFATLAQNRDQSEDQPSPPVSKPQKKTAKERKNATGKANLEKYAKFDMTIIPGVDYDTAAKVISEVGIEFDRFPDEHHFVSYIGLAPSLGKSAGKNVRQKRRCKNTSRAGQAIRMAASSLWRSNSALGAYYRNVARRSDKKTAVKATARRIAQMIYRGVRYGKEFIDIGAEAYEARLREKVVRTVNKYVKNYGINIIEIETYSPLK